MLDPELETLGRAGEVETGVGPGGEVSAASEGELGVRGGGLARVVDEQHRGLVVTLEGAQRGQNHRDVRRGVLIDGSRDPDERIEDEEARTMGLEYGAQAHQVLIAIDAQDGDIEEVDGELWKGEPGDGGESIEAGAECGQAVFGTVEEDGAGGVGRFSEDFAASRHSESDLCGKERLADFGVSNDQSDTVGEPEIFDQPLLFAGLRLDFRDMAGRERFEATASDRMGLVGSAAPAHSSIKAPEDRG